MTYEATKRRVQELQKIGAAPRALTADERADWAFGNAVIENENVTREMARIAVDTAARAKK